MIFKINQETLRICKRFLDDQEVPSLSPLHCLDYEKSVSIISARIRTFTFGHDSWGLPDLFGSIKFDAVGPKFF